jgi:quinoprotein glucose dehydrogenase
VWPIEERAVPASDVPGEQTAATQPFPTKPPPFDRQGTYEQDLIDYTPELHAQALALFRRFRTGPLFTPPSLEGSLVLPGPSGGSNWRGAAFDPETGVLYVTSITQPSVLSVKPGDAERTDFRYETDKSNPQWTSGDWAMDGLPLFKGPQSRITALDLNRGELRWQVPNGDGPIGDPRLARLGLPPLGAGGHACALVTKTLVVVDGGSALWIANQGEPYLRAYDKATGEEVGEVRLPALIRNCAMTYLLDGKQYIVVSVAGEHTPPALVALALPE